MIVLGADMHKRSHTIAAVDAATGALLSETTVQVGARGFEEVLVSARGVDRDRAWALEDCRHVSGSFEQHTQQPSLPDVFLASDPCEEVAPGGLRVL